MAKSPEITDISKSREPEGSPPEGENPTLDDSLKEQNGNQPSAPFVSTGTITVTTLRNRSLRHNGLEYKGGSTLDLPKKDAEWLIKNHYAVAGSLLPEGGIIIPKTYIPKAGNDVG